MVKMVSFYHKTKIMSLINDTQDIENYKKSNTSCINLPKNPKVDIEITSNYKEELWKAPHVVRCQEQNAQT